jgi:cation:H+ antiporter
VTPPHPHATPGDTDDEAPTRSKARIVTSLTLAGLVVVAGGYLVTRTGDALAEQTGLGSSFVGAILLALATSLPEVSTTLEAVRLGRHRLAFSNIFGTNLFDVGFLFVADVFYRGGGVLEEVGSFSQFAALLGILLTGVYVAGILRRRKRVVLRMGIDSAIVIAAYAVGVVVLYGLR